MDLIDKMRELINKKVSYLKGFAMNEPNNSPISWEEMRGEKDKYFV